MEEMSTKPSEPTGTGTSGFTLLDGIALVAGAAIASVHLREAAPEEELAGAGWVLMWLTFGGIALTASGPFLALIRHFSGRPGIPVRLGDRLWVLLGIPWVLAALSLILVNPRREEGPLADQLYEFSLTIGLGLASLITLVMIWSRWIMVPPEAKMVEERCGWTHKFGLTLAVAWPIQCGLGMVVLGSAG